jgi:hypothetical protein
MGLLMCFFFRLTVDEVSQALELVLAGDGAEVLELPMSPVGQETVLHAPPVAVPLSPVGRPHGSPGVVAEDDTELAIPHPGRGGRVLALPESLGVRGETP